jgi:hypothetical protein
MTTRKSKLIQGEDIKPSTVMLSTDRWTLLAKLSVWIEELEIIPSTVLVKA